MKSIRFKSIVLRIFYGCNFNFVGAIFSLMENPQGSSFSFEVKQQQPNLNLNQENLTILSWEYC